MSDIDPTKPTAGQALTQDVRDNFAAAATEIDAVTAQAAANAGQIAGLSAIPPFTNYLAGYNTNLLHTQYFGDLNAIVVNSNYLIDSGTVTNAPPDMTAGGFGFLFTDMYLTTNGGMTQVIRGMAGVNAYKMWMRHLLTGAPTFSPWRLIIDQPAGTAKKYYADCDAAGNGTNLVNLTVAKGVVGAYTYTFDIPLAGTAYFPSITPDANTAVVTGQYLSVAAQSFSVRTYNSATGAAIDTAHKVRVEDYN